MGALVNSRYWRYLSVSTLVTLSCVPSGAHTPLSRLPISRDSLLSFSNIPYLTSSLFGCHLTLPYPLPLTLPVSHFAFSHFCNIKFVAITTFHQLRRTSAFTSDIHICNKLNHIKVRPSMSLSHLSLPISLQASTGCPAASSPLLTLLPRHDL